jgi:type VI secretion system protein ImpH
MAAASGKPGLDLTDDVIGEVVEMLREEPFAFSFFQAVRLLQRFDSKRQPVGDFAHPSLEAIRFASHPSLAFPASEIQGLEWPAEAPPKMVVNFMGLTGPIGTLPHYYTEFIAERVRNRDTALRDFLDIFNHRMISLFYRAWEKHQFAVGFDSSEECRLTSYILDLIGLGTPGLQMRQSVSDNTLMFYSGLLALQTRSTIALQSMLVDYFGLPVVVEDFVGVWRRLDASNQCLLEEDESCSLGISAVVGDEVWDHSRVRIRVGPLDIDQYRDFLPEGNAYSAMKALTKAFSTEVEYELQLVLKASDVFGCVLESDEGRFPLGWLTWINSQQQNNEQRCDTILLLDDTRA